MAIDHSLYVGCYNPKGGIECVASAKGDELPLFSNCREEGLRVPP